MKLLPPGPRRPFARRAALRALRERPLEFIVEMAQRYGDLVCFGSWWSPLLFVNHPELVREVLVGRPQDFVRADAVRNALRIFDGDSILVSEGDQWRQQRLLLQQGFRAERLVGYSRTAVRCTREMLSRWPAAGTIRLNEAMSSLCMAMLSQILLGAQPSNELIESIRIVLDARALEAGNAVACDRVWRANPRRVTVWALADVHAFLDDLICIRKGESDEHGDMLGMLVRARTEDLKSAKNPAQVNREIRDETISMMNASLDATAAAMSWLLFLVAKHPHVQTRLREELEHGTSVDAELSASSVALPFAENVVFESLRLFPPNWVLITRHCVRESSLGGYLVPQGSSLFIFPYVLHRDPRWFPAPEAFSPDRFASPAFGSPQRSAYIPLGLGPHVCIGRALSTILLTSVLARILQEFRLELADSQPLDELEVGIVLKPPGNLQLRVTRDQIG